MIESVSRDNRGYRSSVVEVENFIIAAVSRDNRGYRSNSVGAFLVRPLTKAYPDVISTEVEKSPTGETTTNVHDYPEYLPAGVPCRVSPLARRGSLPRQPTRPQGLPARAVFRIITKIT